jgi:hypothetical protein
MTLEIIAICNALELPVLVLALIQLVTRKIAKNEAGWKVLS